MDWFQGMGCQRGGKNRWWPEKSRIYPSAQLGSDEDVIEQAIQGVNVAVLTDGGRMANYVNDIGIIGMPYMPTITTNCEKSPETETFAKWGKTTG